MSETHVMFALLEKRARKLGQIRANKFRPMFLRMELAEIDGMVCIFMPDEEQTRIKPKAR